MNKPFDENQFYTPEQFAKRFNRHVKTIRKKARDGKIDCFLDQGRISFLGSDLNAWFESIRIKRGINGRF